MTHIELCLEASNACGLNAFYTLLYESQINDDYQIKHCATNVSK